MTILLPENPAPGYYIDGAGSGKKFYYDGANWYLIDGFLRRLIDMDALIADGTVTSLAIPNRQYPNTPAAIMPGDTVSIKVSYKYKGPAITGAKQYIALGEFVGVPQLGVFTDKIANQSPVPPNHGNPTVPSGCTTVSGGFNSSSSHIRNLAKSTDYQTYDFTWTFVVPDILSSGDNDICIVIFGGTPAIPNEDSFKFIWFDCVSLTNDNPNIQDITIVSITVTP